MENIDFPGLGTLVFDADLEWWVGSSTRDGSPFTFQLSIEELPTETQLQRAAEVLSDADFDGWVATATEDLLELYNASWRDDDPQLEADEFAARLVVEELTIYEDDTLEVSFRADGLFADHRILVSVDANGNVVDVDI